MFWINKEYRNNKMNRLDEIIEISKNIDIPVIIHPSNFIADNTVNSEFKELVKLAKENTVSWIQK